MGKKQLWLIIAGLILLNGLTIVFFLAKPDAGGNQETVATVGKEKITKQEWLNEMETRHGEAILKDLIDQKVIRQMAEKYKLKVSDKDVERELSMYKAMYGSQGQKGPDSDKKWKQQIKYSLLLEELLTKDVNVTEKEMKAFYEQNKDFFSIPPSYHFSQIVLKTEKEAKQTVKELEQGSEFAVLAIEKSIDEFSANDGGDVGYISEEDERFPAELFQNLKKMKPGQWSQPIETELGYTIVQLHEKISGKDYSYKEIKKQIHRQIALEQMDVPVSARAFWDELGVDWFYGKK